MAAVYYHTDRFPPDDRLDRPRLDPFIGPATAAVARYDGMLAANPNPGVLLAPLTTREAVLSPRIEGTQATMGLDWIFERPNPRRRDARRRWWTWRRLPDRRLRKREREQMDSGAVDTGIAERDQ